MIHGGRQGTVPKCVGSARMTISAVVVRCYQRRNWTGARENREIEDQAEENYRNAM